MTDEVYILDTSALIAGFIPSLEEVDQMTVSDVIKEARGLSVKLGLETAITSGQVKIEDPPEKAVAEVKSEAAKTGDTVSNTDIKLLALAFHLHKSRKKPVLVTDDYAIQNLAALLGIPYSRVAQPGIKDVFKWKKICPSCGEVYPPEVSRCKVCGSWLKREPELEEEVSRQKDL